MKAAFLSTLAVLAHTQEVILTTNNECWKGEGGRFVENCDDVYFLTCDIYEVDPDTSCNVFTFSDSRLTWQTNQEDVTVTF
jgi:hypothetical protein